MKIVWISLIVAVLSWAQASAAEKESAKMSGVEIQKVKSTNSFENILREMWGKLRSIAPKIASDSQARQTQIAGVRGAESTGTLLKPYWKGDRTTDQDYRRELVVYNEAQHQSDVGNFSSAISGFSSFIKTYSKSSLRANAQFGLGLSYSGAGSKQKSISALNRFIRTYPRHPLNADARQMIRLLRKG